MEKHGWQQGEKPGLQTVWCRWPVTSTGLKKPAFTMTMTSRLAWFRKQLDHIKQQLFPTRLLKYCCCQLSGCWLTFMFMQNMASYKQTLPYRTAQACAYLIFSILASVERPLWIWLMFTQSWGLGPRNYIPTIQSEAPDYHTDQPDSVWAMQTKDTRLELEVRKGETTEKFSSLMKWFGDSEEEVITLKLQSCQPASSPIPQLLSSCNGF